MGEDPDSFISGDIFLCVFSYHRNVRLVRNESSGPMFKNVVPEDEFEYIVKDLKENQELQYTLVLANVQKLGLQNLIIRIKKK